MAKKRLVRTFTPVLALVAIGTTSCGVTDTIAQKFSEVTGTGCVDEYGPNSTANELVDALFAARFPDPTTGQATTFAESIQSSADQMNGMFQGIDLSADEARKRIHAEFDRPVPEGGDARFADAACELSDGFGRVGPMWSGQDSLQTPHFVRTIGRFVCMTVAYPAEESLAGIDKEAAAAEADASEYRRKAIAEAEQGLASLRELDQTGLIPDLVRNAETALSVLEQTPPDELARSLDMFRDLQWAAVEHVCPEKAARGFDGQTESEAWVITDEGYGPIRIGMTESEVLAVAAAVDFEIEQSYPSCRLLVSGGDATESTTAWQNRLVVAINTASGRVAGIDPPGDALTDKGLGAGTTYSDVVEMYPSDSFEIRRDAQPMQGGYGVFVQEHSATDDAFLAFPIDYETGRLLQPSVGKSRSSEGC